MIGLSQLITRNSVIKITDRKGIAIISTRPRRIDLLDSGECIVSFGGRKCFSFRPDGSIREPKGLTAHRYQGPRDCFVPLTELVQKPVAVTTSC